MLKEETKELYPTSNIGVKINVNLNFAVLVVYVPNSGLL